MHPVVNSTTNMDHVCKYLADQKLSYRRRLPDMLMIKTKGLTWAQCFQIVHIARKCTFICAIFFCLFCCDIWRGRHLFVLDSGSDETANKLAFEIRSAMLSKNRKFVRVLLEKYIDGRCKLWTHIGCKPFDGSYDYRQILIKLLRKMSSTRPKGCGEIMTDLANVANEKNTEPVKACCVFDNDKRQAICDIAQYIEGMPRDEFTVCDLSKSHAVKRLAALFNKNHTALFDDIVRNEFSELIFEDENGKKIYMEGLTTGSSVEWFISTILVGFKRAYPNDDTDAFFNRLCNAFRLVCNLADHYVQSEATTAILAVHANHDPSIQEQRIIRENCAIFVDLSKCCNESEYYIRDDKLIFTKDGKIQTIAITCASCNNDQRGEDFERLLKCIFPRRDIKLDREKLKQSYAVIGCIKNIDIDNKCTIEDAILCARVPYDF
jgi:hypothetical protein